MIYLGMDFYPIKLYNNNFQRTLVGKKNILTNKIDFSNVRTQIVLIALKPGAPYCNRDPIEWLLLLDNAPRCAL